MQLSASKSAPVGFQCLVHGSLRIHKQRRAMLLRQRLQAHTFDPQRPVTVMNMGMAGQCGMGHGGTDAEEGADNRVAGTEGTEEDRAGAESAGAATGTGAGVAGCGCCSTPPGRSVWGRVARALAGTSLGRNKGPRWPQAASVVNASTLVAQAMRLARIWKALNIGKL